MWAVQGQSSDELVKRLAATLAVLERELEQNPRVLSIGLHPHIAGVPHRLYYLEKALDMLMSRTDTIFVTSGEIADWFVTVDQTGLVDLQAALELRAPAR
jgi:CII-binding regulator of phage lambda lysogenization HflD